MDHYLSDIRRTPLLTPEEEASLTLAARGGDSEARHRLISGNLRLVVSIAKHYRGRGLDMDDLVGEGNLGLIRAIDRHDPGRSVRVATHAKYWIREGIGRAIVETARLIRIPYRQAKQLRKWRQAERDLAAELSRPPTPDEVAGRLRLTPKVRDNVLGAMVTAHAAGGSLEMTINERGAHNE